MDEKLHAPCTNFETPGISDPKQPGFDLDSSDGMAHDSPVDATDDRKPTKHTSKSTKSTRNTRMDEVQCKVDALDEN